MRSRRLRSFALSAALLLSSACDRDQAQAEEKQTAQFQERRLLDPLGEGRTSSSCRILGGEQILRARTGDDAAQSVEVGGAAFFDGGVALAAIRQGTQSRALLFVVEQQGRAYELDLGRVFGGVEFPMVAANGKQVFVAIGDNEATSRRLRIVRVEPLRGASSVVWGPAFSLSRDESEAKSVVVSGQDVVVAWDDYENAVERSRIRLVRIHRDTLQERGPVRTVSRPEEDAVEPELELVSGRLGLSYVRLEVDQRAMVESALVDEPKRRLVATLLGREGLPEHLPKELSTPDQQVLAHSSGAWGGRWAVAYRSTRFGSRADGRAVQWVEIGADGSIDRGRFFHEQLGPGAPVVLAGSGEAWLFSPGDESQLLGTGVPSESGLRPLAGLDRAWVLARRGARLLTMTPSGLDFVVRQAECSFSPLPSEPEPQKAGE